MDHAVADEPMLGVSRHRVGGIAEVASVEFARDLALHLEIRDGGLFEDRLAAADQMPGRIGTLS